MNQLDQIGMDCMAIPVVADRLTEALQIVQP